MSFDFSKIAELSTARGKLVELKNSAGNVIWAVQSADGGKVILEVKKITADTYAGETTYTGEEFILLDIYPKTNGTVTVTYGGLTKTITDTSGAAEPNAQQVFFGTFNGVADEVETPASGTLTIEGDCSAVSIGAYAMNNKGTNSQCACVTGIISLGRVERIPKSAFSSCAVETVKIPNSVKYIGNQAFYGTRITSVHIPESVVSIGSGVFFSLIAEVIVTLDSRNKAYKMDGECLIEIATNKLNRGHSNSVIPSYVTSIERLAFFQLKGIESVTLPSGVTSIGNSAFNNCTGLTNVILLSTTPPALESNSVFSNTTCIFTVPVGCGEAYKAATYWSDYADRIVEAT